MTITLVFPIAINGTNEPFVELELPDEQPDTMATLTDTTIRFRGTVTTPPVLRVFPQLGSPTSGPVDLPLKVGSEALDVFCRVESIGNPNDNRYRIVAGRARLEGLAEASPPLDAGTWKPVAERLWTAPDETISALRLGQDGLLLEVGNAADSKIRLVRLVTESTRPGEGRFIYEGRDDLPPLDTAPANLQTTAEEFEKVFALVAKQLEIDAGAPTTADSATIRLERAGRMAGSVRFEARTTDSGSGPVTQFLLGLRPDWGLRFGETLWRPGWVWVEPTANDRLMVFSDVEPPDPTLPPTVGDHDLILDLAPTTTAVQLLRPLVLRSTGLSEPACATRPYTWAYAVVRTTEEAEKRLYPPSWVRYRLDDYSDRARDPFAARDAGLTDVLRFTFGGDTGDGSAWRLDVSLINSNRVGSRLVLVLEEDTRQLIIVDPHVLARSPSIRLYRREMTVPGEPPEELDIAATTSPGALLFVVDRGKTAGASLRARLHGSDATVTISARDEDDESALRLYLPGPLAAIDRTLPAANLPPVPPGLDVRTAPLSWRLNEGLMRADLEEGAEFRWSLPLSGLATTVELTEPPPFGRPRATEKTTTATLLPQIELSRGPADEDPFVANIHHRSLLQEIGEELATAADGAFDPIADPRLRDLDFRHSFETSGSEATARPILLTGPSATLEGPLANFLPGALLNGATPKVIFQPAVEPSEPHALTLRDWPDGDANSLAPRTTPTEPVRWLDGRWRWSQAGASPKLVPVKSESGREPDGATVHSFGSGLPPVFQHAGIKAVAGALQDEQPWIVFATSDDRLAAWLPLGKKPPVELTFSPSLSISDVQRVVVATQGGKQVLAVVFGGKVAASPVKAVNPSTGSVDLQAVRQIDLTGTLLDGERDRGLVFERFNSVTIGLLLVGNGSGARLLQIDNLFPNSPSTPLSVDRHLANLGDVRAFATWNWSGQLLVATVQASGSIELRRWRGQNDFDVSAPQDVVSLPPPAGLTAVSVQAATVWWADKGYAFVTALLWTGTSETARLLHVGWHVELTPTNLVVPDSATFLSDELTEVFRPLAPLVVSNSGGLLDPSGLGSEAEKPLAPAGITIVGPARNREDDVVVRLSPGQGDLPGPASFLTAVVGSVLPGRVRSVNSFVNEERLGHRKRGFSDGGQHAVTGDDWGFVRFWDAAAGVELARIAVDRTTPPEGNSLRGRVADNAGVIRDASLPLEPASAETSSPWRVEQFLAPDSSGGSVVLRSISTRHPIKLVPGGGPLHDVQIVCDSLKLEPVVASTPSRWQPVEEASEKPTWPGQFGLFAEEGLVVPKWPVIHGLAFLSPRLVAVEFLEDAPTTDDARLGLLTDVRPATLEVEALFVCPTDLPAPRGRDDNPSAPAVQVDQARIKAAIDEAATRVSPARLRFNFDSNAGQWTLTRVETSPGKDYNVFWRFSLSAQETTSFAEPALSGRLVWLMGRLDGDAKTLVGTFSESESRALVMDRLRPLADPINVIVRPRSTFDGELTASEVREKPSEEEGLAPHRQLAYSLGLEPVAAQLLHARDRTVAITATSSAVSLQDAESGRLERVFSDDVSTMALLPLWDDADEPRAAIATVDGSVWITRFPQFNASDSTAPPTQPTPVLDRRLGVGVRLIELCAGPARPWKVDESQTSTPHVLLVHGADGTAQLWDLVQGECIDVYPVRDGAAVSTIALGPVLDNGTDRRGTLAIGRSDGSIQVDSFTLDGDLQIDKTLLIEAAFPSPVGSVSLGYDDRGGSDQSLFVLATAAAGNRPYLRDVLAKKPVDVFDRYIDGHPELATSVGGQLVFSGPPGSTTRRIALHAVSGRLDVVLWDSSDSVTALASVANVAQFVGGPLINHEPDQLVLWLEGARRPSRAPGVVKANLFRLAGPAEGQFTKLPASSDDLGTVDLIATGFNKQGNFILTHVRNATGVDGLRLWRATPQATSAEINNFKEVQLDSAVAAISARPNWSAATACRRPAIELVGPDKLGRVVAWDADDGNHTVSDSLTAAVNSPLPPNLSAATLAAATLLGEPFFVLAQGRTVRLINRATGDVVRELLHPTAVTAISCIEESDESFLLLVLGTSPDTTTEPPRHAWRIKELSVTPLELTSDAEKARLLVTWARRPAWVAVELSTGGGLVLKIIPTDAPASATAEQFNDDAAQNVDVATVKVQSASSQAGNAAGELLLATWTATDGTTGLSAWRRDLTATSPVATAVNRLNNVGSAVLLPANADNEETDAVLFLDTSDGDKRLKRQAILTAGTGTADPDIVSDLTAEAVLAAHHDGVRTVVLLQIKEASENGGAEYAIASLGASSSILRTWSLEKRKLGIVVRRARACVGAASDRVVRLWDRTTGRIAAQFIRPPEAQSPLALLALDPAQTLLAVVRPEGIDWLGTDFARRVSASANPATIKAATLAIGKAGSAVVRIATDDQINDVVTLSKDLAYTVTRDQATERLAGDATSGSWAIATGSNVTWFTSSDDTSGTLVTAASVVNSLALLDTEDLVGSPLLVIGHKNGVSVIEGRSADAPRRTWPSSTAAVRVAALRTPDGPRILVGQTSNGSLPQTIDWQTLTFRGMLRLRAGDSPLSDFTVKLGSTSRITAQITPGRRLELRFDQSLNQVWNDGIEARFHASAVMADVFRYGFTIERVGKSNAIARGALALWAEPNSDALTGTFCLEQQDADATLTLKLPSSPNRELRGARTLLTSIHFDTEAPDADPDQASWTDKTIIARRSSAWLARTANGGSSIHLLLVDQPFPVTNGPEQTRAVAGIRLEQGDVLVEGLLPVMVQPTSGQDRFVLTVTDGVLALLPDVSPEASARSTADVLIADGPESLSQTDPPLAAKLIRLTSPYLQALGGQAFRTGRAFQPPRFAAFKDGMLKAFETDPMPIEPLTDHDLFTPYKNLPRDVPFLAHQSVRAGLVRVSADAAKKLTTPPDPGVLSGLEGGQYALLAIEEAADDTSDADLTIRLVPVAVAVETLSPWETWQTETLIAIPQRPPHRPNTDGRPLAIPLAALTISAPVRSPAEKSLLPLADICQARERFGLATFFVLRTLHNRRVRYDFLRGNAGEPGLRRLPVLVAELPEAGSTDLGLCPLSPPRAAAAAAVRGLELPPRTEPIAYVPLAGEPTLPDRLRRLRVSVQSDPTRLRSGTVVARDRLLLGMTTAFQCWWVARYSSPVADASPREDGSSAFVPLDLAWTTGPLKPGSLQSLMWRLIGTDVELNAPVAGPPLELAVREPQRLNPPTGARLTIQSAQFEKSSDDLSVVTLAIEWAETIGTIEAPEAVPPETPMIVAEHPTDEEINYSFSNPEAARRSIALTERFEETIVRLPSPGGRFLISEKGGGGMADLFLTATFRIDQPLKVIVPPVPDSNGDPLATELVAVLSIGPANPSDTELIWVMPVASVLTRTTDDEALLQIYRSNDQLWTSLDELANPIASQFDLLWIANADDLAGPIPLTQSDLKKKRALTLLEAIPVDMARPSGLPSLVSIVARYADGLEGSPAAVTGLKHQGASYLCERTLATGPAASQAGIEPVQRNDGRIALQARGQLQFRWPSLGGEVWPSDVILIKSSADGALDFDHAEITD